MSRKSNKEKFAQDHMTALIKEVESNVMISDKDKELKMEIGQSLFNIMKVREVNDHPCENDEELIERINLLFQRCAETGQIPTIEKASIATGLNTRTLKDLKEGRIQGFSIKTKDIVRELYVLCGAIAGDLAFRGVINPIVYIFTAKNYFDMTDKQEVVVSSSNELEVVETVEAIEAKYNELPQED